MSAALPAPELRREVDDLASTRCLGIFGPRRGFGDFDRSDGRKPHRGCWGESARSGKLPVRLSISRRLGGRRQRVGQGAKQIHEVYASPGTVNAYRKTGNFPDGTVLVKEVYETSTDAMTTGIVSRAKTLNGWFVMVRDSKNVHPGNKLWGDGWVWSWFDAAEPTRTTSTDYEADCQGCHRPAQATHRVYVEGYPLLRR